MVPEEGLEPSRIAPRDFESRAYTNSATPATVHPCLAAYATAAIVLYSLPY
jgi:hypothetical protein